MIFNLIKKFLLLCLTPFLVYAQFTKNDSALVSNTFKREFNKEIISGYLNSHDSTKVRSALLSISHSNDTSFIPAIIGLNYTRYAEQICFAIGQIGPCSSSESFLLDKVKNNFISSPLLQALGKCGSKISLDSLASAYKSAPEKFNGISLALFNFNLKRITDSNKTFPVLLNELINKSFSKERQVDAAFTICRSNFGGSFREALIKEIKSELAGHGNSDAAINKLYYMLGAIRTIKYFPADRELFNSLINREEEIIRIEAAKVLVFFPFKEADYLNSYLKLFDDKNPNVTRTAATALKEISLPNELRPFLQKWIDDKIKNSDYSPNTKGELLKSYINLFSPPLDMVVTEFSAYVTPAFLYEAASINTKSGSSLNCLLENFSRESNRNKLLILQSLLDFQDEFKVNPELIGCLVSALNSDFAPAVSVAADGIDSLTVNKASDALVLIVQKQVKQHLNDADFAEAIVSLVNLSEKIDSSFAQSILKMIGSSKLFSIQKFISDKSGVQNLNKKDGSLFPAFWENAFKYSYAEIETSKGKFKIKFLPEYAPISVGNFVYLSSKGFYGNVYFHRVVPAFVIQAGDTTATGWGGPGYEIVSETSPLHYIKEMVGMASAGKDTEGSQWFVTTGYYPHLNGKYTIFGEVIEGMETVYKTDQDDKILSVKLLEK